MCEKDAEEERHANFVYVRSEDGKDTLSLRFSLHGREHRLLRAKEEPVGRALKRIVTNLSRNDKVKKKKKQKEKGDTGAASSDAFHDSSPVEVVLYASGTEVSPVTANHEAWVSGNTLRVDDTCFLVTVNTPTIKSLQLPTCLIATCPAVPLVEIEFAHVEHCRWSWRRCSPGHLLLPTIFPAPAATDNDRQVVDTHTLLSSSSSQQLPSAPVISTSFIYWTTEEDEGHYLVLECTPRNQSGEEGEPVTVASKNTVSKFRNIPMSERHLLTPSHLAEPHQFRVVSYNILANVYATSERARSALYPYCDPAALDQDYRQCLIAREILGYHGDVVCLQEVGTKSFSQFLSPALHQWGYKACFHAKAGKTPEGEAIFFNSSRFSLLQDETVVLREFVRQSPNCRDILSLHPLVLTDLLKRHNILQSVLLQSTEIPNSYLLVANTHLYFHPMSDHIRLLQVAVSLKFLETKLRDYRQGLGPDACVGVVFCGDFNSCPCTAAYSYLLSGSVGVGHPDWQLYRATQPPQCSCNHRALNVIHEDENQWAEPQSAELLVPETGDFSTGLDLSHNFQFSNVCGTRHSTNVTLGWTGVIDYIFADSNWLDTLRVVPFPAPEHLTEHVALPSINFPSDHVALVADLTWKTEKL